MTFTLETEVRTLFETKRHRSFPDPKQIGFEPELNQINIDGVCQEQMHGT